VTESEIKNEPYEFKTFKHLSELYFRASNRYFFDNKFDMYFFYYKLRINYSILHFISESLKSSFENYQQRILGFYRGNLLDEVFVKFDIEALLPEIKKTDPKGYNLIMIYFLIHQSVLNHSKTEFFLKSMALHSRHLGDFSRSENEQIFMISVTYCINQTNTGNEGFYRILFDLINEKIRTGYINELRQDNIPVNNFRDYVIIALRLGELDWIKKFIDDFSPVLPERFRDDEKFIALGLLKLEEKKYEDAVKLFDKVKKTNYLHYIDSGMNKTRAYYNIGYFDEALEEIKKIRNYISYKEGIPELYMKNTNQHLKDIEQLLRHEFDKIDKTGLEHYFRKRKPSSIRRWVRLELEKMKIEMS
jgi:tetratricopeptide (TPR) repeat protein